MTVVLRSSRESSIRIEQRPVGIFRGFWSFGIAPLVRLKLSHVFFFDIVQQLPSAREVALQGFTDLDWHDCYLIVRCLSPRNWTASGN